RTGRRTGARHRVGLTAASVSGGSVALDERERPLPRVCGLLGVVLLPAAEEAVRRAVVDDDLVLHAGRGQRAVDRRVVIGKDVLVVAGLKREDRRLELGGALCRSRGAVPLARRAVHADGSRKPVAVPGL